MTATANRNAASKRLLRAEDVAKRICLPGQTVKNWVKRLERWASSSGYGPRVVRVGNKIRYKPRDVEAWLNQ